MNLDVGMHLKSLRQLRGLSQRELAKRAGVTNGLISLIEQNRVSPSVSSLKKVLDGMPMTLADFFAVGLAAEPEVFFPRDTLTDIGSGAVQLRLVGGRSSVRGMSILHEHHAAGADTGEVPPSRAGEVGGVVIRGTIELTVAGESRLLSAGDAYYFKRSQPHRFRNASREECEIVSASTSPAP